MSPFLSVIVPVRDGARVIGQALAALAASDLSRGAWELLVVDDGSTDDTSMIAAPYADLLLRLPGKSHGPAYARNRAAELARGAVLVFVDADVCVHRDTLRLFAELFEEDPELSAAMGSYDDSPPGAGLVSQFRNLLHYHVHHLNPGEAETFWAGCGAMRRSVFHAAGMFDEWHYSRPQIEDIELGRRLRAGGHRIVLRPDIQCTHLKRWTFRNFLSTDFQHRGVPWTRLLIAEGPNAGAATLNLRTSQRVAAALSGLALLGLLLLPALGAMALLAAAAAGLGVLLINWSFYAMLRRTHSWPFALAVLPLHILHYLVSAVSLLAGGLMNSLFGEPASTEEAAAQEEVGYAGWPPAPARPRSGVWAHAEQGQS